MRCPRVAEPDPAFRYDGSAAMADSPRPASPVTRALEILAAETRERIRRHPLGHLAPSGKELEIALRVPTGVAGGRLDALAAEVSEELDRALASLLHHLHVFRPGRVWCYRCASAGCEHGAPSGSLEVFAGYGPSGLPRFVELGQRLLEVRHPEVDQLYRQPPGLLTHVATEDELTRDLLPAFRDRVGDYRLHGQVAVGLYPARDEGGVPHPLALSFQVVSTGDRGRRRFGLNLVGAAPGGEPLEVLQDRIGEIPWAEAASWAQRTLTEIEGWATRKPKGGPAAVQRRVEGLLGGLARRLEKGRRARDRKTRHARERHEDPNRPTRMALSDLASAREDSVLLDTRRQTLVVLGDRGRAHVFNERGKLVTSIRYSPASIEKKVGLGLWQPAGPERIESLRKQVETAAASS